MYIVSQKGKEESEQTQGKYMAHLQTFLAHQEAESLPATSNKASPKGTWVLSNPLHIGKVLGPVNAYFLAPANFSSYFWAFSQFTRSTNKSLETKKAWKTLERLKKDESYEVKRWDWRLETKNDARRVKVWKLGKEQDLTLRDRRLFSNHVACTPYSSSSSHMLCKHLGILILSLMADKFKEKGR